MTRHPHPASRGEPLMYTGYEPDPPPLSRAEDRDEDDWCEFLAWRRWLARRGYTNRAPRDRGYRRERARVRQAARTRFYLRTLGQYQGVESVPDALRLGRQNRDLRCPCSCPQCGNPRRHFGTPTVGELREAAAGQLDAPLPLE